MNEVFEFFRKLGDTSDWPPRWHCGRWSDFHGWLYIVSDLLIWSAYFCIPLLIVLYIARKRKEGVRFQPIYLLFASFILACGTTHFFDALMFWVPAYRISALVRLATGIVSWVTIVYLIRVIPVAFALKSPEALEREVTLREEAERALRQRAAELNHAQRMARLGSWVWDAVHARSEWSDTMFELWELPRQASLQLEDFLPRVHPADRSIVRDTLMTALETGQFADVQFRILLPDGSVRYFQSRGEVQYGPDGRVARVAGTDQDVTARRQMEAELQEKARLLEEAQVIAKLGYWQFDSRSGAIRWSDEMYRIFGWPKAVPVTYDGYMNALHPADRDTVRGVIETAMGGGDYPDFYHRIHTVETGLQRHVFARGEVLRNEAGDVIGLQGTVQDVTAQRVVELQMLSKSKQLERTNAELESFAYVASHDLQEPLRKVLTFSSMLRDTMAGDLSDTALTYLEKIDSSANRMKQLVHDILEFSRLASDPERFVPVDLAGIAKDVSMDFELLVRQTGGAIRIGPLPQLEAVPAQMAQLLQNLIGNALKFRRPDVAPVVSVSARVVPGAALDPAVLQRIRNHYPVMTTAEWNAFRFCCLTVQDNGIGFEPEYADRIFALFQRLHGRSQFEGTGIGLAVCKKIVSNHHGAIRATGAPDAGACFEIVLPVQQGPLMQALQAAKFPATEL